MTHKALFVLPLVLALSACSKESSPQEPVSSETLADPDLAAFKNSLEQVNDLEALYQLHRTTEAGSKREAVATKLSLALETRLKEVKTLDELNALKKYAIRGTYGAVLFINKKSELDRNM
ncbi:MAG: hypothetical protein RLZZ480_847 [Candidatus Parcubacteria bacterium]|jgi:hypothetical protein